MTFLEPLPPDAVWQHRDSARETLGKNAITFLGTLYVQQPGAKLSLEQELVKVHLDQELLLHAPIRTLRQIALLGPVNLTPALMRACLKQDLPVYFLSTEGKFRGVLQGPDTNEPYRVQAQFALLNHPARRLEIARQIVLGKAGNSYRLLRRWQSRYGSVDYPEILQSIKILIHSAETTPSIEQLRGYEGAIAARYFEGLKQILAPEWEFNGRNRRPPRDPVNVLLSLGYTWLFKSLYSLVRMYRLYPYAGVYHELSTGHPALVSDLMEEFRAPVIDWLVLSLIRQERLKPENDFLTILDEQGKRSCTLLPAALKRYIEAFEDKMLTLVRHHESGLHVDYRRCMELQVRQYLQVLEGTRETYVPYTTENW